MRDDDEWCLTCRLHDAIIGPTVGAIVTLTIAPTVAPTVSTCKRRRMTAPTATRPPLATVLGSLIATILPCLPCFCLYPPLLCAP